MTGLRLSDDGLSDDWFKTVKWDPLDCQMTSFRLSNDSLPSVKWQVAGCQMTGLWLSNDRLWTVKWQVESCQMTGSLACLLLAFPGFILDAYLAQEKGTFKADDSRNVSRAECVHSLPLQFCIFLLHFPCFPTVFRWSIFPLMGET